MVTKYKWLKRSEIRHYERVGSLECAITKLNGLKRSEIWHWEWFGILECIFIEYHWLKLRKVYSSFHSIIYTSQWEWCSYVANAITTETPLAKLNGLKGSEIWHWKWFDNTKWTSTKFDWLKLREIYSSFHSFVHTSQWECCCSTHPFLLTEVIKTNEAIAPNFNRLKRREIRQFKWLGILKCFITQFDWLKLRKSYTSLPLVNHTNQGEWWCSVETILTKVNGLKRREIGHLKWLCILEWIITYFNWSETTIVYSSIIEWPY